MENSLNKGVIYLIPTPLGANSPLEVLPFYIRKIIEENNHFIIENEKEARRFIKRIAPTKNQENLQLYPLNKFTSQIEIEEYLEPCKNGISMGLFSDAGCPGIADPGAAIVRLAHKNGITVKPMIGPSSIILAMMAAGMNGQNFAFNGYLPIEKPQRRKAIKQFETKALKSGQSQIFIETPYRNNQLFTDFIKTLHPETKLCVACDITLETEFIKTKTVSQWKKTSLAIDKRPAIFILDCDPLTV